MRYIGLRLSCVLAGLCSVSPLLAQSADPEESLTEIVVTGTRVADRSALDTAVPVDVISAATLNNIGVSELAQAMSVALPSLNFPRPGLNDGTDTVRPATLRGLNPDQTLVLVNGKRRHSAALVNVNQSIGRGSAAVDLNTIPNAALMSVEVLRDGASAQYGSDAIAGVINLRLREARTGGEASASYGWRDTSYDVIPAFTPANAPWASLAQTERSRSDGQTVTVSLWKGLQLGGNGFITVSAEYKDADHTERSGYDGRQQYALVSGAFDPREQTINRFDSWYGEPEVEQKTVFLNAGYELTNGAKLYSWASWQERDALSGAFFRQPQGAGNITSIYPDGFIPLIAPNVNDYAAAAGITWNMGEWMLDASLVYGQNDMDYFVENTLNRSLGPTSKTEFDAGSMNYSQYVANLAGVRGVEVAAFSSPLNVAVGIEARREGYSISAGEPDSYRQGGVLLAGAITAPGAQGFPGFRPQNSTNENRTAVGAYIDLEANVTEKFLASIAVRGEHYSDFGSNASGKLSLRYDFVPAFALRGSLQNGFRAPSLQQQFFTTTSTNFINGQPFDVTTFPATSPVAAALGAQPLDAEKSLNYSLGAVFRAGGLSLTVDAYWIKIDDRIVLSENLTAANVQAYIASQGFGTGIAARFFINGVDTETQGVDIVASYPVLLGTAGKLDLTASANFNSTDVTKVPTTSQLGALNPAPVLFSRVNVLTFEEGWPDSKVSAAVNWTLDRWGATLRATRYGETLFPSTLGAGADFRDPAATLVDLEARAGFGDHVKVAIGADNVLDKYPKPFPPTQNGLNINATGTQSFSNYSPFGRSGRFIYARLGYTF
jgi:iron complex outermembrane receptor protein